MLRIASVCLNFVGPLFLLLFLLLSPLLPLWAWQRVVVVLLLVVVVFVVAAAAAAVVVVGFVNKGLCGCKANVGVV